MEHLDPLEVNRRCPALHPDLDDAAIFDPSSGVVFARRTLMTLRRRLEELGVEVLENTRVTDIANGRGHLHYDRDRHPGDGAPRRHGGAVGEPLPPAVQAAQRASSDGRVLWRREASPVGNPHALGLDRRRR